MKHPGLAGPSHRTYFVTQAVPTPHQYSSRYTGHKLPFLPD
jgi:hypothetical protein